MQRLTTTLTFSLLLIAAVLATSISPVAHAQSAKDQANARAKAKEASKADAKTKARTKALIKVGGPSITMAPNSAKRILLSGSSFDYSDMVRVSITPEGSKLQAAAVTGRLLTGTHNGERVLLLQLTAAANAKQGKYTIHGLTRTNQPRPMRLTVEAPQPKPTTDSTKKTPPDKTSKPTKRPGLRPTGKPGSPKARSFFNANALKQGVNVTKARALTVVANKSMANVIAALRQKRESQFKQANRLIANDRARLKTLLESDKTGKYAKLLADKAKIDKSKLTPQQRADAMKQLLAKNQPFIKGVISRANIDAKALSRRVGGAFKDARFKVMTADGGVRRATSLQSGTLVNQDQTAASASIQPFVGEAPYPVFGDRVFVTGLTISPNNLVVARADEGRLSINVSSIAGVGGAEATAYVGHTVQVPSGVKAIDVTVNGRTDFGISAVAVVAACGASADMAIQVDGPNGFTQKHTENIATVFAPVLWYSVSDGDESYTLRKRIDTPTAGEYEIRMIGIGGVWTAGFDGMSGSFNVVTVRSIRVDFLRE